MANTTILYGYWLSSCTWRVRAAMNLKKMTFEERSIDIVRDKAQLTEQFRAINPSQKVPALFVDGATIVESMAIIDYLDDTRPDPPLKPSTPLQRARMQEICETSDPYCLNKDPDVPDYMRGSCMDSYPRKVSHITLKIRPFYYFNILTTSHHKDLKTVPLYLIYNSLSSEQTVVSGIQPLQNIGLKGYFETEDKYNVFTKHWTERGLQSLEELLKNSAGAYSVGDQMTKADICLVPQVYNAVTRHKLDLGKYPILSKLYEKLLKEESFRKTHPMIVRGQKYTLPTL